MLTELKEKLTSTLSTENYLETILILSQKLPVVRSVDIANELGFKKSSISIAMKNLREKNQITVTNEGYIYLTEEGKQIADDKKSMAFSVLFTPKEEEFGANTVDKFVKKILKTLNKKLNIELRS